MKTSGCAQSDLQFFSHAKQRLQGEGQEMGQVCAQGWRDVGQIPILLSHLPIAMTDTEAFPFLTMTF